MEDHILNNLFPNGLHLMVVDNDPTFLKTIQVMLSSCCYKVTTCDNPNSALSILRERAEKFDLLLTDVHMPEMSGFELLKIVEDEFGIPVILMSVESQKETMIKAIEQGACYFLEKPLNINLLRNIWKQVAWKKISAEEEIKSLNEESRQGNVPQNANCSTQYDQAKSKKYFKVENIVNIDNETDRGSKKSKKKQIDIEEDHESTESKKQRIIWTPDLEKKFKDAIEELGIDAVPSRITKFINVAGVERHHVASHLQKYRIRKIKEENKAAASILQHFNLSANSLSSNNQLPNQPEPMGEQSSYIPPHQSSNPPMLALPEFNSSHSQTAPNTTGYVFNIVHVQECLGRQGLSNNIGVQPNERNPTSGLTTEESEGQTLNPMGGSTQPPQFDNVLPSTEFGASDNLPIPELIAVNDIVMGDGLASSESLMGTNQYWQSTDEGKEQYYGVASSNIVECGQQHYGVNEAGSSSYIPVDDDFIFLRESDDLIEIMENLLSGDDAPPTDWI